jgi:sirohydrochlorin ferrochelatase
MRSPRTATVLLAAIVLAFMAVPSAQQPTTGILLLAHGGSEAWNQNVRDIAASAERTMPTEVAFGMATRANIQKAIDKLVERGATRIVAVPLFVSSHSSVITSTEYLLGLRRDMPPDLLRFAKMSHSATGGHAEHVAEEDGTKPVSCPIPLRMAPALDAHPIVVSIVASRAAAISRASAADAVVLVAHGPVDDVSNERWLENLRTVAALVRGRGRYASVDAITVRDDAPAPIRDAASAELRELVQRRAKTNRVLIVPVLLSYGGIEEGIRKRLAGLDYVLSAQALAPDDRLLTWVLEMARSEK